jgi:two-component system chemotaxis sensor kinase CheA
MIEIDSSLLNDFATEAGEHLEEMESVLLRLAQEPDKRELLDDIFRPIHTIKGASQFMGLERISGLSHKAEDLLDLLRRGEKPLTQGTIDTLMEVKDRITLLVSELMNAQGEQTEVADLVTRIEQAINGSDTEAEAELSLEQLAAMAEGQGDSDVDRLIADSLRQDAVSEGAEAELSLEQLAAMAEGQADSDVDRLIADSLRQDAVSEGAEAEMSLEQLAAMAEGQADTDIDRLIKDSLSEAAIAADLTPIQPIAKTEPSPEVYEEEYDKELFQIFLKQLQEKIFFLRSQATTWSSTANKIEALDRSLDSLKSLESAANYMGYANLIALYQRWADEVRHIRGEATLGHVVSLDCNEPYITQVVTLFPQLDALLAEAALRAKEAPIEVAPPPQAAEKPSTIADKAVLPETPAAKPAAKSLDDPSLLEKLSNALEASMKEASGDEPDEHLLDVFEQMLASSADQPMSELSAYESEMPTVSEAPAESEVLAESAATTAEIAQPAITREALQEPSAEPRPTQKPAEERRTTQKTGERVFKKSVRVDADKIDSLMNQVGELIVDRSYFFQLFNEMRTLQQHLKESAALDQKEMKLIRTFTYRLGEAIVSLGRTSNELQEGVMKVRMLPIAQLFNRYPRLVHDLTHHSIDKQVQLEIKGEDTELDRMIIEEISDPLIHIIRNAVDHGFETTTERKRAGKPEIGTLVLEAYHESNHIVIEITDDGRGIDPERVKAKALERGLYSKEELDRMGIKELTRLIMTPGFSTAEQVTNTSGRGVGMDVVKKNVERLNGTLEIESKVGAQTQIRLKIPLTLAIIQALMVGVGENHFTIPLANVEETLRIFEHQTSLIEGAEVIYLRGKPMPIFRLSTLFAIPVNRTSETKVFVVIVNSGFQKIGLVVDELMGQEEVVIKPLADYLQEKSGFSGATIIGDGRISLILDIYELINMAMNQQVFKHQDQSLMRKKAISDHNAYPISAQ